MESLPFKLLAGPKALTLIKERGLTQDMVQVIPGAAGGPKWLILSRLDQYLFGTWFKDRTEPLELIGASAGAWRFAAAACSSPVESIRNFERLYVEQSYPTKPSPADVAEVCRGIIREVLHDQTEEILNHANLRLTVLTNRCRNFSGSNNPKVQLTALAIAGLANVVSKRAIHRTFERNIFRSHMDHNCFDTSSFAGDTIKLANNNLEDALVASGAIPIVIEGVQDISGSKPGVHRDGGVIDYHFDIPLNLKPGKVALYPHFQERIIPGWFDKKLRWRKPSAVFTDNLVLLTPTDKFVAGLPGNKIPDRIDFKTWFQRDEERISTWNRAIEQSQEIADAWQSLVDNQNFGSVIEPLGY